MSLVDLLLWAVVRGDGRDVAPRYVRLSLLAGAAVALLLAFSMLRAR